MSLSSTCWDFRIVMSIRNYVYRKYFATEVEKLPMYVCHPVDMFEGKPVPDSSLESNYFTPL